MAAVDSEETIEWLLTTKTPAGNGIIDDEGNFDGECPAYLDTCDAGDCNDSDGDGDGVIDVCDACPFTDNNLDSDDDGILDCADPCDSDGFFASSPDCDPGGDFDCDGTCNGVDDCPFASNTSHTNANSHAEAAWEAGVMADACEPVPVPAGEPRPFEVLESQSVTSSFFTSEFKRVRQDRVQIRPLRSRSARFTMTAAEFVPEDVPTRFRYCPYEEGATPCDAPALVDTFELHMEVPNALSEMKTFRYHRISMSFAPGANNRGADVVLDYDDSSHNWRWFYQSDTKFWQMADLMVIPPPEDNAIHQGGTWSGLEGRFWVHAATTLGTPGNNVGTGTHVAPERPNGEELASRYFDLDPECLTATHVSKPLKLNIPFFIWRTLSDPAPDYRYGVIEDVSWGDAEIVVQVADDSFALMNLDGTAQLLENRLGPALRENLLSPSLVWAAAAEPSPWIGSSSAPMAVAITDNGLRIAEEVVDTPDALLGQGDRGIVTALAALDDGELGIHGFKPVYSRSAETVYLVGGKKAAGGRTGTIARGGFTGPGWAELVPPVRLKKVLAATYSYRTQSLYILDRRHVSCDGIDDEDICEDACEEDPQLSVVRFIRVDALRGGGEVIASWAGDDLPDDVWLGSDLEGHVLFSFSRDQPKHHAIVRFDVNTGTVSRLHQGPHPLALPVLVDANGFVIYTKRPQNKVRGNRFSELEGSLHFVDDLESLL